MLYTKAAIMKTYIHLRGKPEEVCCESKVSVGDSNKEHQNTV
jgi:hypothetical protein